jgi:hypothetical protein
MLLGTMAEAKLRIQVVGNDIVVSLPGYSYSVGTTKLKAHPVCT